MLLPRSDPTADSCNGHGPCLYDSSPPTDPTDETDLADLPRSEYGYMGITMVAILALLAFALWLYSARRKANRAKVREEAANDDSCVAVPHSALKTPPPPPWRSWFGIGRRKPSSLSLPATRSQTDPEANLVPLVVADDCTKHTLEKGKEPRWVSQSGVRKGLVKEVYGGMVVYTAPNRRSKLERPKPTAQPPRKDRDTWHLEHVHGVRYEARTPPENDQGTSNGIP